MKIAKNATILFQGDSITDAGRNFDDPTDLGLGYPLLTAAMLSAAHPDADFTFYNRGVGGNRSKDVLARIQSDILDLKPDIMTLLIGINDCWRRFDSNEETPARVFEENCRKILSTIRETLPATQFLLLEPFVLPYPEDRKTWRTDLDEKIQVIRSLAVEFGAEFIPLDGIFAQLCCKKPSTHWSADGVHPTYAGHGVIAQELLSHFQVVD